MADQFLVAVRGISALDNVALIAGDIATDAFRAVNAIADSGRAEAARRMLRQIAFPTGYLAPRNGRLAVSKYATAVDLEARIRGRGRPTSLARFARGAVTQRGDKKGVSVKVGANGVSKFMEGAFFVRLKSGKQLTETQNNQGLAIRLRGRPLRRKHTFYRQLSNGLFLMYGPSIDQLLSNRTDTGIAHEMAPTLADELEREFLRLRGLR